MKDVIETKQAPEAIGPYSQARMSGDYLFTSGQIPINPQTGAIVADEISAQAAQVMENLKQVLIAADMSFNDVLKTTVFITDMNNFAAVNEVYGRYFTDKLPARSCVAVAGLPKGALVEIEMIACNCKK
ncbi:RidA family protein [Sporomusa acidovorans]|uniref:2-iminobutanoate/2-iminopropanoate deaminase n=1 Tax=Sporomusa acidovorans (strain ATCC 49682 / DSM 3132 / Mol) TaxID=1123286 RepID=A0ABZ3JBL8_SPOA4|nr:RidA family protein [Sporomusa acidovorans]OZC21658.1 2-iminobutanoate/2-iminopropanoate deaminase [Sporomusa acidovorans DSM 3132]SDD60812.1 endoribonuclease L-PSP [Sporomusa acidovorans]